MRLAVILPSLSGGGIEKMRLHLIHEWLEKGIEVDLVVGQLRGALCNKVPDNCNVFEIAKSSSILFPVGLYRYFKSRKPTHILSATKDVNVITLFIVSVTRIKVPVVVSFHNHLQSEIEISGSLLRQTKDKIVVYLFRKLSKRADKVVAVSKSVAENILLFYPEIKNKLSVIYNPTINSAFEKNLSLPLLSCPVETGVPWILFVGRFVYAKGVDILLHAFDNIREEVDCHLILIGEGPLKKEVMAKRRHSGLEDKVHILEFQENILPWMRESSVFVLPSRFEGLPNVLIEAMASGANIVATDCSGGSSEILENGKYGTLVAPEDPIALANAVVAVLKKEVKVANDERKQGSERFAASKAAEKYLSLLVE